MKVAALVHKKVKHGIGMDRARGTISGAAPISTEVLEFFAGFDLNILEVYGQSEGTGPTTFNQPGKTKFGSVGLPYPGTEVKLAEDGEVLLRGGNVFAGYYKDPKATADAIAGAGWYRETSGHSTPTDSSRSPAARRTSSSPPEARTSPPRTSKRASRTTKLVSEAVLIGDRRKYLTALVTLDPAAAATFADEHGISGPLHLSAEIRRDPDDHRHP